MQQVHVTSIRSEYTQRTQATSICNTYTQHVHSSITFSQQQHVHSSIACVLPTTYILPLHAYNYNIHWDFITWKDVDFVKTFTWKDTSALPRRGHWLRFVKTLTSFWLLKTSTCAYCSACWKRIHVLIQLLVENEYMCLFNWFVENDYMWLRQDATS
jgi:hypothetical protein